MLRKILLLSLLTSATLLAGVTSDPVQAAKDFYRSHENFYCTDPTTIRNLITPRLYHTLKAEYDASQGEVGAIDADPWIDAQDGEIHPPITFTCVSDSGKKATVKMSYLFFLGPTVTRPQTVLLNLEKDPTSAHWLIADLKTPHGESLIKLITHYRKKYP